MRTPRSRSSGRRGLAVAVATAALSLAGISQVGAVHDLDVFELDGNAVTDAETPPPYDWDAIFDDAETGALAQTFIPDGALNATIFTGGGSKDGLDISSWKWKDNAGGLPDKDNLTNAYAARYAPEGEDLLYFGADRYDNSGDAAIGFWFFKNKVQTVGTASGGFTGLHAVGDLLILSNFSGGGPVSTIFIYEWVGTGGSDGTLDLVALGTEVQCGPGLVDDDYCATVNPDDGTPTGGWEFTDKSGNTTFLQGEFFEGGVNLTDIGLGGECYASFAVETRSSTSVTATLKDFVLGNFGECGSTTVTTPSLTTASIATGSVQVTDSAVVTATGSAGITVTGSVDFYLCGPLTAPALCETGGTHISTAALTGLVHSETAVSDPAIVTSAGRYCFRAEYSGDEAKGIPGSVDFEGTECFTVTPVQPTLATTAGPDVVLGNPIADSATLTGTAPQPGTPVINPTTAGLAAGGTITFTLYGPSDTACGALVYTSAAVPVNGDGTYGPVSYTPTLPGIYHWKAAYTGSLPNTLADDHNAACTDTAEDVVVLTVPSSMTTAQWFYPNDNATISATAGGDLAGTVTFTAYETANCSGTALLTQDVAVAGASPQTVSTSNTTISTTSANISWLVGYDSSNDAQQDIAPSCHENTVLTITNGGTISSGWEVPALP